VNLGLENCGPGNGKSVMADMTIIDTDILVDVARGIKKASQFLNKVKAQSALAISSVTEMELLVGCRNKAEQAYLDTFLSGYKRITIDARISDEAVNLLRQFRLSHGLLIADAFIAATVKVTGAGFVTKNYKHYRFIPDLDLKRYS
jgi:predicted nucleic acid-binding protein